MVLTKYISDDPSALLERPVITKSHLMHGIENSPMHRFESVSHVGKCTAYDDRHGIIEIRLFHLIFYGYR
jgi:hypothetical protein